MSEQENPDKMPPMKSAEEFAQEELKSARNGIAVFLVIAFTFCRIIQIFSRRPGTSGRLMMAATVFSILPFLVFYEHRLEETGQADQIDPRVFVMFFATALALDLFFAAMRKNRYVRIPPRALGAGILDRIYAKAPPALSGFVSDMTFCVALLSILIMFNSPIQVEYFRVIASWIVLSHVAIAMQYWWFVGRIRQTRRRATYFHTQIKGR